MGRQAPGGPSVKVALVDLDMTGFPNLALMKLSAWSKAQGHEVLPLNFIMGATQVYASCIFPRNARRELLHEEAMIGGTGFGSDNWLPLEIEHTMPDYSLYAGVDYSVGFTSRGCIRDCPWCVVPGKEGYIQPWASIYEFWDRRHRKIKLLDNNLLAAPNWRETLLTLIHEGLAVDFNQGLDIRLINEENASLLAQMMRLNELRFSFDSLAIEREVREGIALLVKVGIPASQLMFYALLGFWPPADDLARLRILGELGVAVFPMNYQPVPGGLPAQVEMGPGIGYLEGFPKFHGPRTSYQKAMRLIKARLNL